MTKLYPRQEKPEMTDGDRIMHSHMDRQVQHYMPPMPFLKWWGHKNAENQMYYQCENDCLLRARSTCITFLQTLSSLWANLTLSIV